MGLSKSFLMVENQFTSRRVKMCSLVKCKTCKKPTWSGCGEHIEEALAGIAVGDRCQGHIGEVKKVGLLKRFFSR